MLVWAASEVGLRDEQQDAYAVHPWCLMVADGMGGHEGGATAARVAVEAVVGELEESDDVESAIGWASRCVQDEGGGGTTLVVALVRDGGVTIGWVGDSRAYRVRDGEVECLTDDHVGSDGGLARWLPDEPAPDVVEVELRAGDCLVLCTDGVSSVAEDALNQLAEHDEPAEWLVEQALDAGSDDNCTAIVFRVA